MGANHTRKNEVSTRLRSFAQEQRSMMTRAEDLVWQQVRAGRFHGYKFKRQVPIAPYVVDFLCASARVIVELDGPPHEDAAQRVHDARRDAFLREQGFRLLRFTNDEFFGNPQLVLDRVLQAIETAYPLPSAGRGWRAARAGRGAVRTPGDPLSRPRFAGPPSPAEGRGEGAHP